MAIQLSDNIQSNSNKALDNKYGPWEDTASAIAGIPESYRHKGLTIGIIEGSEVVEYWWLDGITNDDLIQKLDIEDALNNRASLIHSDLERDYYPTYNDAITAAVSGDTLVTSTPIDNPIIVLPSGVSLNTGGFPLGTAGVAGTPITMIGGTGVIAGNGSVITLSTVANYSAIYNPTSNVTNYRVQDLHVHASNNSGAILITNPNSVTEFYRLVIKCDGINNTARIGSNTAATAKFYNCIFHISGNARTFVIDKGVVTFYNCTFILDGTNSEFFFQNNGHATFNGCRIFATGRTATTPLFSINGGTTNIVLRNTQLISNDDAIEATVGSACTVTLEGTTVVHGAMTNITLVDNTIAIDALPSQTGHGGEFLTTDGTSSSWSSLVPVLTTGTVLTFDDFRGKIYGSTTTPETGNITASTTDAIVGATNLVIHNSGTEPTFDSKFKKVNTSKSYELGVNNYIYCQYLSATKILYIISQEA